MARFTRIELWLAVLALVAALAAGGYLISDTLIAHQTCYGITNSNIRCQPVSAANLPQTFARLIISLVIVLLLYVAGALSAWWQQRAGEPGARTTAYMALVTTAITTLAITLAALGGTGFFFIPGTVLLVASACAGLPALYVANRRPA